MNICKLILGVVGAIGLTVGYAAAATLDQQNVGGVTTLGFNITTSQPIGQTFTSGLSGQLGSIELELGRTVLATGDVIVTVYDEINGVALGSSVIAAVDIPAVAGLSGFSFVSADFSTSGITISSGEDYWFEATTTQPSFSFGGVNPFAWLGNADGYAGGFATVRSGAVPGGDMRFKTYVTAVPMPASLPLLLAGLGGLAMIRRRRKAS